MRAASPCSTSPSAACCGSATDGLELIEIAPGVDLERDVLARMAFRPRIAPDLREMDAAIFTDAPLGLGERSPLTLDERVDYRADDDLVFINFEGLTLDTLEAAEELAAFLGRLARTTSAGG